LPTPARRRIIRRAGAAFGVVYSLRFRLILMVIVVSSATAVLAALFANAAITDRFENYLRQDQLRYAQQTRLFQGIASEYLTLYYAAQGEWPPNLAEIVVSLSAAIGHRVILQDTSGHILADSAAYQASQIAVTSPHIGYAGDLVASVYVQVPAPIADAAEETAFIASVGRSLVSAVVLSAASAMGAGTCT
jgi:hypothetical protein